MNRLTNLFLFAGTDRKSYRQVRNDIIEGNRKNLVVFLSLTAVAFLIMVISSFLEESLVKNRAMYATCAAISTLLLMVVSWPAKRRKWMTFCSEYVFMYMLLVFGIVLGTYIEPNETTVSYAILIFAVPLLFTDRPITMIVISVTSILLYVHAALATQTHQMFIYNMSNIIPYGLLSLIASSYMMTIKVSRYVLLSRNNYLIESDQMTGLLNRHSYNQAIEALRTSKEDDYAICLMDVNGLKMVNDTLGHIAGDELIMGAANCITDVFGPYGNCFRIGGDEFVVIMRGGLIQENLLRSELEERTRNWKGTLVKDLSISAGIAQAELNSSVEDVLHEADMDMYKQKYEFYKAREENRNRSEN